MIGQSTPLADWLVVFPVLLGLMGGAGLLMLRRRLALQAVGALVISAAIVACDLALYLRVLAAGPVTMTMGKWRAPFGISFTVDVLGAGLALIAAVVTLAVVASVARFRPTEGAEESAVRDGFFPLTLILLAGVSGSFLTGDLFNLYVWFEVTLIAAFGLMVIGGRPVQLEAAVKYGVLNFLATTLLLAALGLFYGLVGTLNMADSVAAAARVDPAALTPVAALFLLAFAMKAAVFPLNAWLPAAYHAPLPATSALMGGLLTKVGVYALLRVAAMVMPAASATLMPVLTLFAVATALLGPFAGLAETNLRRALGFLLIGGVGVALLGLDGGGAALAGSIAYIAHAMLTVAALYLLAGWIEARTGESDLRRMGGLGAGGWGAALFFALVLAAAGVPPFLGFWPKLMLAQAFISDGDWLRLAVLMGNAWLTLIVGARLWTRIFWRGVAGPPLARARPPTGGVVLALAVVVLGAMPQSLVVAARIAATDLINPARYIASAELAP